MGGMGSTMMKVGAAAILVLVGISFIYFVANLLVKALLFVALAWVVLRVLGVRPGQR